MSDRFLETFFNTDQVKRFAFPGVLLWGVDSRRLVPELVRDADTIDVYVDAYFAEHALLGETLEPVVTRVRSVTTVASEPPSQEVVARAAARSVAPDATIAVGGGSTLDFAKAVGVQHRFGSVDGVGMGRKRGIQPLEGTQRTTLVALPTTAGTGAEASRYYVTYDRDDRHKVHGKTWGVVADWILLDPAFVQHCPDRILATTAFDAFVHLFESFVCRNESSWFGRMLSCDAIPRLMRSLDAIVHEGRRSDDNYLELLYCASVGGMAISNVRTGNIHEAAGALLEMTSLSHPETLIVFYQKAYEQYADRVAPVLSQLFQSFAAHAPSLSIESGDAMLGWWSALFDEMGTADRIRGQMTALAPLASEVRSRVFERVWSDRVWIEKESPIPLDADAVHAFVDESLARYGLPRVR